MRHGAPRLFLTLLLMTPLLAGCLERGESTVQSSLDTDDDTYCQANGSVKSGSPQYAACRKDRDVQRDNATKRTERKQRDLAEYMMNHPDHP
jgi:hypothetical protein